MDKLKKSYPYIFIVLICILPSILLLKDGFVKGHDNEFHYAQIQDLYDSWKNGHFFSHLNYEVCHSIGMGVRLMYASFSHFITVVIAYLFSPFGISLTSSMKLVIFLSILLSGIFTYHFVNHITDNCFVSLVAAAIYVLFPYRYTDVYVRNALAETVAFTFIPLAFDGIYQILHNDEGSTKPFLKTIAAVVLLFYTHNITFIYTVVFLMFFVLFFYKNLFIRIKERKFWIYTISSLGIMLMLVSWLLIPLIAHYSLDNYRIFDAESMRTGLENMLTEIDRTFIFLGCGVSYNHAKEAYLFVVTSILLMSVVQTLRKYYFSKNSSILGISGLLALLFSICLIVSFVKDVRPIFYVGLGIEVFISFILVEPKKGKVNLPTLLSSLFLLVICFMMATTKGIWKVLPDVLYTIQFPWRLWAFFALFLGMFIAIILDELSQGFNSITLIFAPIFATVFLVIISPTSNEYDISSDNKIDISDTYNMYGAGWQLEYFPIVVYEGPKTDYWWRLYQLISEEQTDEIFKEVGIFNGKGSFSNYEFNDNVISFDLIVEEGNVLVEVPRVYYLGYKITLENDNGSYELTPFESEMLVSFETNLSGHITVEYEGTTAMKMAPYIVILGVAGFTALAVTPYILVKRTNKRKNNLEN